MREEIKEIFLSAIDGVLPHNLIKDHIHLNGHSLKIMDKDFDLFIIGKVYVLGAGKASAAMAEAIEEVLKDRIEDGIVIVKYGHTASLKIIRQIEAGHPVPDINGVEGTLKLLQLLKTVQKNDLIIVLISGGGSSLLIDLPAGVSLPELKLTFDLLLKSGADIQEMNIVRKHLSSIKGGGLARACYPATTISLILSDVINDPLDIIASGPTVFDSSTVHHVWQILFKYQLQSHLPLSVLNFLKGLENNPDEIAEKKIDLIERTFNYLIGTNRIALELAKKKAFSLGFHATIIADDLKGDAEEAARDVIRSVKDIAMDKHYPKPACLLWGGETTIKVKGNGKGGRNQHFALSAALELKDSHNITLLSAGTDGTDGPTGAAGAIVDQLTIRQANAIGLNAQEFLLNNDSYSFFERVGGHLITGPTRTNVMDIIVVLVTGK